MTLTFKDFKKKQRKSKDGRPVLHHEYNENHCKIDIITLTHWHKKDGVKTRCNKYVVRLFRNKEFIIGTENLLITDPTKVIEIANIYYERYTTYQEPKKNLPKIHRKRRL